MIPLGYVWFSHTADYSFPSDHMTIFVCFALALISAKAVRTGLVVLGISILVAWSRIYLGVHFPLDMIGGVITGMVSNALFCRLWKYKGEYVFSFLNNQLKIIQNLMMGGRWQWQYLKTVIFISCILVCLS
jgi:undecaprenyl-diphosphatase